MEEPTSARNPLASQTVETLLQRLEKAGFGKDFVNRAIIPEWWNDRCSDDPGLLQDLEIRIARFLGHSVKAVADPNARLKPPPAKAHLRRVRDIDRDRLAPAIHAAIRIASAVVRNLRKDQALVDSLGFLPGEGLAWREQIKRIGPTPTLTDIAVDLWGRGIPVVPLDVLPAPYFQGMACIAEERPVILLGYKHDEPGRAAFLVGHEAGHIAAGDCEADQAIVDEEEEIADDSEIERRADLYATRLLMGDAVAAELRIGNVVDFKDLARRASDLERAIGVDASSLIFTWARRVGDYATATMAVKALYRNVGARRLLRELFARHVDIEGAPESDRSLLNCVHRKPVPDEAAG